MRESMEPDARSMRLDGPCEATVAAMSRATGPLSGEHLLHISRCRACKALAERLEILAAAPESPGQGVAPPWTSSGDCPDQATWLNVAAGLAADDDSARLLEHAAGCDRCGVMLKAAVQDLDIREESGGTSEGPDERPATHANVSSVVAMPGRPTWRYGLYAAAIAAGLMLAAVVWMRPSRMTPERLIANAYRENRTIAARLPGADYAPLASMERSSSDEANIELLRAETAILENLKQDPQDVRSIALRSRVDLLRRRYDAAIDRLQPLLDDPTASRRTGGLDLELGTAYLARAMSGDAANHGKDAKVALQMLQSAVKRSPNDPVALFNRALAAEAVQAPRDAEEAWTAFLRVEPKGGWANEAEHRLANLKKKRVALKHYVVRLELSAPEFMAAVSTGETLRAEDYLDRALTDWAPAAARQPNSAEARALEELARMLNRQHQDPFLEDFSRSLSNPRGLEQLAEAIRANAKGDRASALSSAEQAIREFQRSGTSAARHRAEEELAYTASRSFRTSECLQLTSSLLDRSQRARAYPWIRIQTLLARASCLGRVGDQGSAWLLRNEALELAAKHRYDVLWLRAKGLIASSATLMGDRDTALHHDLEGLKRFWEGAYPPMRAYQFYSDLDHQAEAAKDWESAYVFSREGLPLIEATGNRTTAAMAHYRLAMFAMLLGRADEAASETRRADSILRNLSDAPTAQALRAENIILTANALLSNGDAALGRRLLAHLSDFDVQSSHVLQLGRESTLGAIAARLGDWREARKWLERARVLAEASLNKLRTARDRAYWQREMAPVYRNLVHAFETAGEHEPALALWQRYRSASIAPVHAASQDLAALRRVSTSLHAASVVTLVQFHDHAALWFFDNRGTKHFRIPITEMQAQRVCDAFQRSASDKRSSLAAVRETGRAVYDKFFEPFDSLLDDSRILLIGSDGPCSGIPFEALSDAQERYLIDRVAVATIPGVFAAHSTPAARYTIDRTIRALVVGDPRVMGDVTQVYPELPEAAVEAASVAARFSRSELLIGRDATVDALRAKLPAADLFHFAGHGLTTSETGALVLASSNRNPGLALLESETIDCTVRTCRLAVLSACSTARGERSGAFRPESLIQSFWRAGVPTVVATRWAVDSTTASDLIDRFYTRLMDGRSPALALREATLGLRRSSENAQHPAIWAGFHVFGNSLRIGGESQHGNTASHVRLRHLPRPLGLRDIRR